MAEAAVEERPAALRFYCHLCNVQFANASADFTCPHCSKGFIEELEANLENPVGSLLDLDSDDDDEGDYSGFVFPTADEVRTRYRPEHRGRRRYSPSNPRHRIGRPRTLTRLASTHLRPNTFENLIHDFIVNLGVGVNWSPAGNMQVILGNPADYAWGREGLDAIVTQLLNQMDTTGPPPLAKDVIDAIPKVEITQQQVDAKLQCSVCWEDFLLKELVHQLPCLHVYHETCIKPWLELHGTCPICRQNLAGDEQSNAENEQQNSADNNQAGGGNAYNTLQRLFQAVGNGTINPSSSGSSTHFHSAPNDNMM